MKHITPSTTTRPLPESVLGNFLLTKNEALDAGTNLKDFF